MQLTSVGPCPQVRDLKAQVATLLRKCDNDDELIAALRGALPQETQDALLASRQLGALAASGLQSPPSSSVLAIASPGLSSSQRRWVI